MKQKKVLVLDDSLGPPPLDKHPQEISTSGNAKATFAILETINRNLNSSKRQAPISSSNQALSSNMSTSRKYEDQDSQVQGADEDETNTVIENECDNDYANLYRSFEVEEETEEMRK